MRNGRTATRRRSYVRKAHALLGLALSANLLILLVTGFLIQHREDFRLDERTVPRWMVPNSYRPQDGPEGVRADIVITDLHSGRVFGNRGALVVDALTIAWFGLLISGLAVYGLGKWKHENGGLQEGNGNGEG